jgi:hypothetical protein
MNATVLSKKTKGNVMSSLPHYMKLKTRDKGPGKLAEGKRQTGYLKTEMFFRPTKVATRESW